MSRRVEDLHPQMQLLLIRFLHECERAGLDVLVTCTHRTPQEQTELYAQGRTKPGPIVTRAKAWQSAHNFSVNGKPASLAFDVVPLRNGKCVWGAKGEDLELWQRIGQIGKSIGLQWYGDPDAPFREMPHFQLPTSQQIMRSGAA